MTKKINLTKMKFLIAALAILSVMSINAFSAPNIYGVNFKRTLFPSTA